MRFSARAVASTRSNAVGPLELESTGEGLNISFLGVGAFKTDYAPGAVTEGHRVLVPWDQLSQARAEGNQLYIEFAPKLAPHNRLTLVDFQAVVPSAVKELRRQRWLLLIAVLAVAFAFGIAALVVGWQSNALTPTAAILACLFGAGAILTLGLTTHRRLAFSPIDSEAARLIFLAELESHFPALFRSASLPPLPRTPLPLPTFQGALPRTTVAIVITLTAASLATVLTARWLLTGPRSEAEAARIPPNQTALFGESTGDSAFDEAPQGNISKQGSSNDSDPTRGQLPSERHRGVAPKHNPKEPPAIGGVACRCLRPGSALWQQPIERMSILALSEKGKNRGRKTELLVDVGVVNNGSEPLSEISLTVRFFDGKGKDRRFTEDRVVYFAGPLGAGKAIKWRVEGEGSEFEVDNPIPGDIGPGGDGAAPADRFFELLEANHRPVRMHGAMMLAYLGDPRAKEAILKLRDALRDNENPYLQRLLWTQGNLRTCDATVKGSDTSRIARTCIYNAADTPQKDPALRWRALQTPVSYKKPIAEPPLVLSEITVRLETELAANSGVVVEAPFVLEGGEEPAQFEVYADRVDLLP